MLTRTDRQMLRRTTGKAGIVVCVFFMLFALLMAGHDFVLARRFATIDCTPFGAVLATWLHNDSIKPSAQFSGAYLRALDRIGDGFLEIGIALFIGVLIYGAWRRRRVHLHVVETLREHGEWPES